MSKQRSQKPKTDTVIATDEQSLTTPVFEGTDSDSLPFPEFSDQDINSERWDNSPSIKDKSIITVQPKSVFEDPQEVRLPQGFAVHKWKRCSEIYGNANFVVFTHTSTYPDLITPNHHIVTSEFYRNFISSIETLLYIGSTKPFPQEYGNPAFATAGEHPWRPWHHIYSNCKISKSEHSPAYNSAGKYVVRLFWLGTWRKIYIDDLMPVDLADNLLLPSLHIPKTPDQHSLEVAELPVKPPKGKSKAGSPVKKDTIELWPMLLCKALLKIASLSSCRAVGTSDDFDIINCLTGWVCQRIKTKNIQSSDLWDIFMAYVERFMWPEPKEGSTTKKTGSTKTKSKGKGNADTPKKGTKTVIPNGIENMRDGDRFVVLTCNSYGAIEKTDYPEDKNLSIFVSQVRDIPLIQPPPRPDLEFWKTFRYEKWAVEQGIIPPDIKKLNIKSLKIVDPFSRALSITRDIQDSELLTQDTDNIDKKSEKSSKSSKKTLKTGKSIHLEPDPSTWIDFEDLRSNVTHVMIYFQPRVFKSKTKISDISFINKTTDFKHTIYPFAPKKSRNEPLYLFMDSIDYKFLIIHLAQMGDLGMLEKARKEEETESFHEHDQLDICEEIVLSKTKKNVLKADDEEAERKQSVCNLKRQLVSLVVEEYSWESNSIGPCKGTIGTFGSKSFIVDLKPGRQSFRLWLSSHCSYVLQIFSDTPLTVGSLEEYLKTCSMESQLLTNLSYDLASSYGKLVQSFGMPEYSVSLRNFYHCYKPFQHLSKRELAKIHNIFFEEFCKIITDNSSIANPLYFIKLLFLQLKTFDYINPYVEEPHLYADKFELNEEVEYAKLMQRAAVKIQAFFKRIYIKALMRKMHDDHKQYYNIFDNLKRIYIEIFSSGNRLNYCPTVIRRFFEHKSMETLNNKFEIYHDIKSVLSLYTYTGTLQVQEFTWVLFCRYIFNVNSDMSVVVKIDLFCNLKNYFLRVFDNDTLKEIKLLAINVPVKSYEGNNNGYTVLCYGWTDDLTKVNWKLVLATKKMSRSDIISIPLMPLITHSFKEQYIPSFDQTICRYLVKIGSDTLLTANVTTSFDDVNICLRLLDKNGKVMQQVSGTKSVLFPVMDLKFVQSMSEDQLLETAGGVKKKSMVSGITDISYTKLSKKYGGTGPHGTGDSEEIFQKRYKKNGEDDEIRSVASRHSENESRKSKSRSTIKRGSLTQDSQNLKKVIEYAHTEYFLEAKVVNNSWPLTAEEWEHVQKIKEKSYLNLLDEKRISSKKLPIPKRTASVAINEPYWILDVAYFSGSIVQFELDNSKNEKRKEIKSKWFSDSERYKRAMQLREAYLLENTSSKADLSVDKFKRSNDPNDFKSKIIGIQLFDEFLIKPLNEVDEDFCKTKSDYDYIIEEANVEYKIKAYDADEEAIQEEIEAQLQEQKEESEVLARWFQDIRNDSMEMLTEAIQAEKEYVKKLMQATSKGKSKEKGKEKKKK